MLRRARAAIHGLDAQASPTPDHNALRGLGKRGGRRRRFAATEHSRGPVEAVHDMGGGRKNFLLLIFIGINILHTDVCAKLGGQAVRSDM
jgi:hypothetical protein